MTAGPRSRTSERLTKSPFLLRSLNIGATSPAFNACRTKPVCTSSATELSKAATTFGRVFASKARRHASSCAFKDMWPPVRLTRGID
jgi:hypothetical protein